MTQARKEIEVWEACDSLFSEGLALTYKNVGDKLESLGNRRGSASDTKKYLDSWRIARSKKPSEPTTFTDPLDSAVHNVRKTIQEQFQTEMEAIRQKSQQIIEEANAKVEAARLAEKLTQERAEERQNTIIAQADAMEKLHQQVISTEKALTQEQTKAENYGTQLESNKKMFEEQMTELKSLFDQKTNLSHQEFMAVKEANQQSISDLQNSHERLLDKKMMEIDKLRTELSKKDKELSHLHAEVRNLKAVISSMEKNISSERDHHKITLDKYQQKCLECESVQTTLGIKNQESQELKELYIMTVHGLSEEIRQIKDLLVKQSKEQMEIHLAKA